MHAGIINVQQVSVFSQTVSTQFGHVLKHFVNTLVLLRPGKIPPDSTLTFVVELLEIRNGPRSHESFQEMDLNNDWKLSQHEVGRSIDRSVIILKRPL